MRDDDSDQFDRLNEQVQRALADCQLYGSVIRSTIGGRDVVMTAAGKERQETVVATALLDWAVEQFRSGALAGEDLKPYLQRIHADLSGTGEASGENRDQPTSN
ncbi:hypothetical protein [Kushneria phosphatilytica]|uniref:Uncharacterized protein n=1 Tax=Kushneria phosphatilytica TaxID=657387 RepID=A0A1S1NZJ2_9GAMM|nr:hypothetical protein [Kushneria phosphatilytica]OHV13812.1 hypothetical protein BH688_00150 [Kushneria phosphatilytica]QEL10365.1 hypothetical protein FY550_03895 [Kushneria phosphatilytica]